MVSTQAIDAVHELLTSSESRVESQYSGKIRCRTARHWLKKLGFCWQKVQEGVYVDGHKRSDVVRYRQEVVLLALNEIRSFLVKWDEEGHMIMSQNLPPGQKPLVLVTHDESTLSANDGKRQLWMENGK